MDTCTGRRDITEKKKKVEKGVKHQSIGRESKRTFSLHFPKQALVLMCLQYNSFENTIGNGEITSSKQFLLFPQCFPPIWRTFCHFRPIRNSGLQTLSVWKSLQFVVWERFKGEIPFHSYPACHNL